MNLSVISIVTPTEQNFQAASGLPYCLLKNLPKDWNITVYSFDLNRVPKQRIFDIERTLHIKIVVVPTGSIYACLIGKYSIPLRAIMSKPVTSYLRLPSKIVNKIRENSDRLMIYGEDLSALKNLFPGLKCIVTGPDCEAMYYKRVLEMPSKCRSLISKLRYSIAYRQFRNLTKSYPSENVRYHLVGEADKEYLRRLNPYVDAIFLPHPHYKGNENRIIAFNSPKIRLLLPGRYDFYSKEAVDDAIDAMAGAKDLTAHYEVTFQGKNWHEKAVILRTAGYDVKEVGFVDCYEDELCKHDIQLSPISVGTGTKGKVLDAFVNGLLVIAPLRAIENIQVVDKRDYCYYEKGDELVEILRSIPKDIRKYELMAEDGRRAVLTKHSPKIIGSQFVELFK